VGRTGRAGEKGTAYTLVTEGDKEFVGHLVRNLEAAGQGVPKDLMDLAMKASLHCCCAFNNFKNHLEGGTCLDLLKFNLVYSFQSAWFKKARFKEGAGKPASKVGLCRGLGFKEESGSHGSGPKSFVLPTFKPGMITGKVLSSVSDVGGPAAGRIGALKAAFKAQYQSNVIFIFKQKRSKRN